MSMAGPAVAPPAGADGQALIEEARRRHRRRRWIAVAVALAVVAGVALAAGLAGGRAGRHPPARRAHPRTLPLAGRVLPGADTTLLAWPGSGPYGGGSEGPGQLGVYVDDLDSGQLALRPSPPVSAGDIPYIVVRAGHWLVYNYNGDAGVAAARDDLTGRPRRLGRAVTFVPSAVPGQVLLAGYFTHTVRPVEVSTGRLGPAIRLPQQAATLLAGTVGGFLLLSKSEALELWRPGKAPQAIAALGRFGQGLGFAMDARFVSYGAGCTDVAVTSTRSGWGNVPVGYGVCRVLRVIDLVTGRRLSFAAPKGTLGWASYDYPALAVNAIAPGNRLLAAPAAVAPARDGTVRLFVLRLGHPDAAPLAVPRSAAPGFAVWTWSASSWLFYQGPGGKAWAFQPNTGQSADLRIPCHPCMAMVSVPG